MSALGHALLFSKGGITIPNCCTTSYVFRGDENEIKNLCNKIKSFTSKEHITVIFISGNNEERVIFNEFNNYFNRFRTHAINNGFKDIFQEKYLTMRLKTFYPNHYPRNHKDNCINLFGHIYRWTGLYKPYGLNVGCDLNYFRLFSEEDIFFLLSEKENYCDSDADILSF